jgi:uncharacterized protein DUF547
VRARAFRGALAPAGAAVVAIVVALAATGAHAARRAPAGPPWAAAWQALLDRAVVVVSPAGAPLATRVDYEALAAARDRDAALGRVQAALLAISPAALDERARLAWAIDTYDFLVIEQVVRRLHDGPGGARIASVRDVPGFFDDSLVTIDGQRYSLGAFEAAFVFPDRNATHPLDDPWRLDPRAHFALCNGSVGAPPLQPRAFVPDAIDAQLDRVTRAALADPAQLRWIPAAGAPTQSQIFAWYPWDFDMRGWEFLVRYAPPALRDSIARHHVTQFGDPIDWDWSLNQAPRK